MRPTHLVKQYARKQGLYILSERRQWSKTAWRIYDATTGEMLLEYYPESRRYVGRGQEGSAAHAYAALDIAHDWATEKPTPRNGSPSAPLGSDRGQKDASSKGHATGLQTGVIAGGVSPASAGCETPPFPVPLDNTDLPGS